jgi:hypothetical protein
MICTLAGRTTDIWVFSVRSVLGDVTVTKCTLVHVVDMTVSYTALIFRLCLARYGYRGLC